MLGTVEGSLNTHSCKILSHSSPEFTAARITPHASRFCNGKHTLFDNYSEREGVKHKGWCQINSSSSPSTPQDPFREVLGSPVSLHSPPHSPQQSSYMPRPWNMMWSSRLCVEKIETNAWPRPQVTISFLTQTPMRWWQSRWTPRLTSGLFAGKR